MSVSALVWLVLYFGGLVAAFAHPLIGLLTYLFEYYLRPANNWWGQQIPDFRTTFLAGAVLAVTFLIHRGHLPRVAALRNLAVPWAVLLGLNAMLVTWVLAVNPEASWLWGTTLLKHLAVYALIIGVVRTLGAFDAFVLMHLAGSAWWGVLAFGIRRISGRLEGIGSGDTAGSNLAAAHLVTVIPFAICYALAVKDTKKRMLALIALPLVLNLFVLYNSRGALVGLGFAALAAVVIVHWQARVRIAAAGVAAALLLFNLADPRFIARQQSTATATDNSALSRLESWKGGARLVLDHPFGTGGRGFHQLSPIYIPDIVEGHRGELRSVHNLYLQTASEWGLQGISFFLMFILCSIYMLHRLRRQSSTADPWYYRSVAIEVGLLGTLVAGIFSDRLYGESIYWMAALSFAAYRIHATTAPAEQPAAPAPVPADVRREPSYSMPRPNLPATTIRERLSRSLDY